MQMQTVRFSDLGVMDYKSAWDLQEQLLRDNLAVKKTGGAQYGLGNNAPQAALSTAHWLLFVEHPPVYTLGKSGKMEHVLLTEEQRLQQGIEFYQTNRGGDITFHGPGQVVGYPVLDLEKFYTDIGRYLRNLEEVIILALNKWGIRAGRSAGETGVWLDAGLPGRQRKICAMGVRCSRWVTIHGFALNVNTDLSYFDGIVPCGIRGKAVTSMERELGQKVPVEDVKKELKGAFERVFDVELSNIEQMNKEYRVMK